MLNLMDKYLNNSDDLDNKITNVIYLFYENSGQKHINASINAVGINVILN